MTQQTDPAHAVVLSAADPERLRRSAYRLREHVSTAALDLADVAYTTQVGRMPLPHRLAVRCASVADLVGGLDAYLRGEARDGVLHGVAGAPFAPAAAPTDADAAADWVGGGLVDWRRYWPEPRPRVPLPGYPFGAAPPAPPAARPRDEAGSLRAYLVELYAEVSGLPAESVDPHLPLTELGLSSFLVTRLTARLESDLGERSRTLFFEHATLAEVAAALAAAGRTAPAGVAPAELAQPFAPAQPSAPAESAAPPAPAVVPAPAVAVERAPGEEGETEIAVIGVAGRYPRSPDLDAFWDNLAGGRDCVTPHPPHRARPGWPTHLMDGGYLDDVDRFDPLLFGITPRDAALMDPQERLFLEVTWAALESAGYTRARLRERHHCSVAVYAGAMWNEYPLFGAERTLRGVPQDSGATLGGIANRVSYCFDLHGPSLTVDTMCSSALVALDLAVQSLRRGEAELAVAGAVSLSLHPNKFIQQHRMKLTASDRRSRTFGAGGDGFVPAEGVGALVLKPLRRALDDGDPVHAVIRGTAVVHAGRTNGYIVPSPVAQADVVRRALRDARTGPAEIGYVEAHGAGTALGDPVEIDGLTRAYRDAAGTDLPPGSIPIGSVKSTIGHTEAAAGLAGLTKVILQLRHGVLAPSLHADELNPNIPWDAVPFRVQRQRAEWTGPRVAGVSSFGAGGTIAHAIVAAPPARTRPAAPPGPQLVVLSAYDEDRLDEVVRRLVAYLRRDRAPSPADLVAAVRRIAAGEHSGSAADHAAALLAHGGPALADIAYTLQVGREPLRQRLAVVVEDVATLCERLTAYRTDPAVLRGRAPAAPDPDAVPPAGASLTDLARHWVTGGAVDWAALHEPGRTVVDLPAYPFARMRCWVPEDVPAGAGTSGTQAPIAEPTTPPPADVPLYVKGWEPDPDPGPAASPVAGVMLCVGGSPDLVARLGGLAVHDVADLTAVLSRVPEVGGLVGLPGGPGWETRVRIIQRLLAERPGTPLRILETAVGDVRTAGFVKVLGAEYARVTATVLHTDRPGDDADLTARILAEWVRADAYGEVRYADGRRHRPRLDLVPAPHAPLRCDPDAAYLVTGGTRGVGALVARHLAGHGARSIALVGVHADTGVADDLRARGVRVLQHAGGFPGVEEFLRQVRAELGPLRGVVHCAGVESRGNPAFLHKDLTDVRAVLAPKLDGFETLVPLCATDPLDFFLVFSSVCATVSGLAAGVSDYAAANIAVDELVRAQIAAGRTEFRSVDWPQWAQTGSTSGRPNPCAPAGLAPLDDAAGLRVVDRVLALPSGAVVLPCPPLGDAPDPDALLRLRPPRPTPASPTAVGGAPPAGTPAPAPASAPIAVASGGPVAPPEWLVGIFSAALGIPERDLDPTVEFGDLGVDSVLLGELLVRIEERLGTHLDPATLLLHPTLERLTAHLGVQAAPPGPEPMTAPEPVAVAMPVTGAEALTAPEPVTAPVPVTPTEAVTSPEAVTAPVPVDGSVPVAAGGRTRPDLDGRVAVIGMACRFPGATDVATLWDNLLHGRCAVTEVPAQRWDHRRWYSPEPGLGRSISKWGGFVEGIEWFDPGYFDMGDDEARCLDPAIRMFLEGTAECLAEAGYAPDELRGRRVAVVAGARLSDYGRRVPIRTDVLRSDQNFIAARVAHHFDLRGPNLVVDSACSSSLVAVQVACRSLLAGESELAVVGGVEVLLDPETYLDLSAARALSPTGRCWTFDERADGFVPGEGCGVVLLKPLAAALADGDRVHAVIDGVAVNNDGHTMGVTTPSPAAQADVVRQALAAAGRRPADIMMLEAHGTGTLIGDPIELRALNDVFGDRPGGRIEIGSVKSNLGHLLSAAGMAGLFKVALALEHGTIPPTLFCDTPNPRFDFDRSPLHPTTEPVDWPAGSERVAGVSSFGLGGTNAHLVLSGAPPGPVRRAPLPRPVFRRRRLWLDGDPPAEAPPPARPDPGEPLTASLLRLQLVTTD
ncbi:SDR family NAD(P)-dependent oxidoreductase [Micromonospora marina]|uniref:SDR family NAD(P)-dependent oxidoreductase n=1 Tax=Micromonospora marina TaxID=307120 RepID=UPI003D716CD1